MLKKTLYPRRPPGSARRAGLASDDGGRGHRERYERGRYEHDGDRDRGRTAARPDPPREWLSVDEVAQKLKEQGYTVRRIEASHGCYEVKATDAKGVRVEMYVDPVTADVVSRDGRS